MSIDWFTFTAQIVNFLVLVWLLKRFLYGPIIRAMQQREDVISSRVQAADEAQSAAKQTIARYEAAIAELHETREKLMQDARQEVDIWKDEQTREARIEVERARTAWLEGLSREQNALVANLTRETTQRVTKLSALVLKELSTARLQSQIIEVFLARLQQMGSEQRSKMREAIGDTVQRPVVESAFEIPEAERQRIMQTVQTEITDDSELTFRLQPELICGIQLRVGSYKVAWTVVDTMQSLQNELAHAMQHLMQSDAISGSQQGGVASQTEGEDSAYEDPEVTSAGGGAS